LDCLVNCIRTAHVVNTLITLHLYIRDNELRVKTNEFKLNRIVCRVHNEYIGYSRSVSKTRYCRTPSSLGQCENGIFFLPAPYRTCHFHQTCLLYIVLTLRLLCTTTTPSFVKLRTFSQEPSSVYGKRRRRIQQYMLPVPVHIRLNRRYM